MALGPRVWTAIGCLVVGAPVAAWGLANGLVPVGLAGLALVLVFVYLVVEAMNRGAKPKHEIPKSSNPAWSMRDAGPPGPCNPSDGGGSP